MTEYANVILKRLKGCGRSLCLDNYPFIGDNYIEKDYLFDLMTAAKVTKAYNAEAADEDQATFGICIQTFEYFCYRSYEHEFFGILDPDGNDRIYDIVKTAGDRVAYLEPILSQYESIGAYMVPGSLYSFNTAAMVMAKDLFCKPYEVNVEGEYDTLVGCFIGNDEKGYMLVNYTDPIRKCIGTVTLSGNGISVLKLYKDGKETVLQAEKGKITIILEYGNSAFVVW